MVKELLQFARKTSGEPVGELRLVPIANEVSREPEEGVPQERKVSRNASRQTRAGKDVSGLLDQPGRRSAERVPTTEGIGERPNPKTGQLFQDRPAVGNLPPLLLK